MAANILTSPESVSRERLLDAVKVSSATVVQKLLNEGGESWLIDDLNADIPKNGLVWTAVQYGRTDVLRVLLEAGGDPNQRGLHVSVATRPSTPLIMAVQRDEMSLVDVLLEDSRTDVNLFCQEKSPLIAAATMGSLSMVQRLLKSGAEPMLTAEPSAKYRPVAIEAAVGQGFVEVVEHLLNHASDPSLLLNRVGHLEYGRTLLMLAAWYGHAPMVSFLLKQGADLHQRVPGMCGDTVMGITQWQIENRATHSEIASHNIFNLLVTASIDDEKRSLNDALPNDSATIAVKHARPRL